MKEYSVEIASAGVLDEGFIDPKTTQDYNDFDGETGDIAKYTAKAKGWVRWRNIIDVLLSFKVASEMSEIEEVGGKSLVAPTKVSFKIGYDEEPELRLEDNTILTGVDAISEMLARGLSSDFTYLAMVWDPTVSKEGEKELMPLGASFEYVTAPKLFASKTAAKAVLTIQLNAAQAEG